MGFVETVLLDYFGILFHLAECLFCPLPFVFVAVFAETDHARHFSTSPIKYLSVRA